MSFQGQMVNLMFDSPIEFPGGKTDLPSAEREPIFTCQESSALSSRTTVLSALPLGTNSNATSKSRTTQQLESQSPPLLSATAALITKFWPEIQDGSKRRSLMKNSSDWSLLETSTKDTCTKKDKNTASVAGKRKIAWSPPAPAAIQTAVSMLFQMNKQGTSSKTPHIIQEFSAWDAEISSAAVSSASEESRIMFFLFEMIFSLIMMCSKFSFALE